MNISVKPNTSKKNKTGGWRTFTPEFLVDKCIACGVCAKICPEGIIEKKDPPQVNASRRARKKPEKAYYQADLSYCKGCGICAANCPVKAIIMRDH